MGGPGGREAIEKMWQVAKRLTYALDSRWARRLSEKRHEFPARLRNAFERADHKDGQLASDLRKVGPAAHTDRNTDTDHPTSGAGAWRPVHGPDPTAEDGFLDLPIEEQIRRLEQAHGIRTDA